MPLAKGKPMQATAHSTVSGSDSQPRATSVRPASRSSSLTMPLSP